MTQSILLVSKSLRPIDCVALEHDDTGKGAV